jgi:short-subunit dehydrogenase
MNDGGSIILNGSSANTKGTPAFGVYAASKAAIRFRVNLDFGSEEPPYPLKRC